MRALYIVVLAVVLVCALPSFADDAGYTIRQYSLHIDPDFSSGRVTIRTDIEIDNPKLAKAFEFTVREPFKVESVTLPGTTVNFTIQGDTLSVQLGKATPKVKLGVVTESRGGKSRSEDRMVVDNDSLFLIWSDAFYPTDFDSWAPVRTTLVMPEKFQAVAPGRMISRKRVGTTENWETVFEATLPQVCFSIFADSRWTRTEREVAGQKMVTLLDSDVQKWSDQIFTTSADVLKYFADLHGSPAPEEFYFVSIPGMGGRRAFSSFVGYPPKALEREMTRTGYDAHETSLLWWGYTAHARGRGAWQWNEGFGDYVEMMYGEERKKPLPAIFNFFRDAYLSSDFTQEPLFNELRGNTPQKFVHGKYPWLMSVLRQKIGDEAFRKGLRKLFADYRYKSYTMDEMFAVFEATSGQSLKKFRAEWVERKGVPELKLEYTAKFDKSHATPMCAIQGNFDVPTELEGIPLDVVLRSSGRDSKQTLALGVGASHFEFTQPVGRTELLVDPDHKLIFKLISHSTPVVCEAQNQ